LDGPGGELTREVERFGRGIEKAFAPETADGCRNVDRIARLPGTINWKTGARATMLEFFPERVYDLEDFPRDLEQPQEHKPNRRFEPPPAAERSAILQRLAEKNFFVGYEGVKNDEAGRIVDVGWITAGMALKVAYGDEGERLWAITHNSDEARKSAAAHWRSFD
jgi:hypothetical protein